MKYKRLGFEEREEMSRMLSQEYSCAVIAKKLGRARSTILREVRRKNRNKKSYRAYSAHRDALAKSHLGGRNVKLTVNHELREVVLKWLRKKWSPQQIMNRLKMEYPQDKTMRISHESIYRYLYVLPKGELRKELLNDLRRKQKYRRKRKGNTQETRGKVPNLKSIDERDPSIEDRLVPGHWEGDLILGKERKCAMGTLVERSTRYTLLVKIDEYKAAAVRKAFAEAFKNIPKDLKKTLTYDQGYEMKEHELFTKETEILVYFAHARSPWERGTNENTNSLVRQYFPQSYDLRDVSTEEIKRVEQELNDRPRKCLGYLKPNEVFLNVLQ